MKFKKGNAYSGIKTRKQLNSFIREVQALDNEEDLKKAIFLKLGKIAKSLDNNSNF